MTALTQGSHVKSIDIPLFAAEEHGTVPIGRHSFDSDDEDQKIRDLRLLELELPSVEAQIRSLPALAGYVAGTREEVKRKASLEESSSSKSATTEVQPLAAVSRPGIEKLRELRDGWMGEESRAPDKATLTDAQELLSLIRAHELPEPMISASAGGVIFFSWRQAQKKATARFEGDGFFGYAMYESGRFRAGSADGDLQSESIPDELVSYLRDIGRR